MSITSTSVWSSTSVPNLLGNSYTSLENKTEGSKNDSEKHKQKKTPNSVKTPILSSLPFRGKAATNFIVCIKLRHRFLHYSLVTMTYNVVTKLLFLEVQNPLGISGRLKKNNFPKIVIITPTSAKFWCHLKRFDLSFYAVSNTSIVNYPQAPTR